MRTPKSDDFVSRRVRRGSRQVVYAPATEEVPKTSFRWRVYLKRIGLAIVGIVLLWVIFFSKWLNVRSISLHGQQTITSEMIKQDAREYFDRFPTQRNILFLQPREMADFIRQKHPNLQQTKISRTLLLGINVDLWENQPALIWQTGNKSWLLGEDGRVIREVEQGDSGFGRVVDGAQLPVKPGDKVADAKFVEFTRETYRFAHENNISIEQILIGETTREILVRVSSGLLIKMAVERGAGEQLRAYLKTIATAKKEGKSIGEYVDVRIVGKTYYK